MTKNAFVSKLLNVKGKKYLKEVLLNMKMKMHFSNLNDLGSKSSIILLLMKDILEFVMKKTNESINYKNSRSLKNSTNSAITMLSMIK